MGNLKGLLTLVIVYYGVSSYFPTGFDGVLPSIPELLWFFPQDFPKILLTFFLKGFWGRYIVLHLLIFPIGFSRSYSIDSRPQEDQIDYKTTRRTNRSRGSVMKELGISDQFCN